MKRRTAAIATAGALAVAMATVAPPPREVHRAYIPIAPVRVYQQATPAPSPTPPPSIGPVRIIEPDTAEGIIAAAEVVGATVKPRPGHYRLRRPAQVAEGVTIDGGGRVRILAEGYDLEASGLVTITGHGFKLEAADVTLRGLTITDTEGDGVSVERSAFFLLDHLELRGPTSDGLFDAINGPANGTVQNTVLRQHPKCSLIGHQRNPADNTVFVRFELVVFEDCRKRTPKIHRATVELVDVQIWNWSEYAVDVQLGGLAIFKRVRFYPGPKSWPGDRGRYRTLTGGRVEHR